MARIPSSEKHPSAKPSDVGKPFWMRLDNAAKIYPAVQDEELTAVFRLSCVLKQPVRASALLEAAAQLEHRFPYYKVKPRAGFFWYYLEFQDERMVIRPDFGVPCRAFDEDSLLFRVLVRGRRLSVEFSHILTDGSGGLEFLKSLLITYFRVHDTTLAIPDNWYSPDEKPSPQEFEDGFAKYFQQHLPPPRRKPKSFHLPFPLNAPSRYDVIIAMANLTQVVKKSKSLSVSMTEYLVAVYLYALQDVHQKLPVRKRKRARPILRIQVPMNLRRIYPSKTMRNFSLFVTPEIDLSLGQYTFEEIARTVHHSMKLETDKKLVNKMIARNVGAERNIWLKNTPLFIKSLILKLTYHAVGPSRYSGVVTNLGKISLGAMDKLIDYFVFIPPPPSKTLKVNCGVIGFEDNLLISFGNIATSRALERTFMRVLVEHGIHAKIIHY